MPSNSSKRIEDGLRDLSREGLSPGHMDSMLGRVRVQAKRRDKMDRAMRRTAIMGAFCALLIAGLLFVPVSYTVRVGSIAKAEVPATGANLEYLTGVLPGTDGVVRSGLSVADGKILVSLGFWRHTGPEAEVAMADMLVSLPDGRDDVEITSEEVVEEFGGNVLAWASGGKILVNAEGMGEEELEEAIVSALLEAGAQDAHADVEFDEEAGMTRIDIGVVGMPDSGSGEEITIEITK